MDTSAKRDIVAALLDRHGRTYAQDLGIDLSQNTPSALFRWLCASILFSARIGANIAMKAAQALADQGWTTAQALADTTWEERVRVLNRSGYARYDESTARMLGDTVDLLLRQYDGDLRRLRDEAGRDPKEERTRLKECKGMGDVGVDIFFREAQCVWDELYPFADKKALKAAGRLGLGESADELAPLADRGDFPRLIAALVHTDLEKDCEAVSGAAGER
jgi:hypothetical protein